MFCVYGNLGFQSCISYVSNIMVEKSYLIELAQAEQEAAEIIRTAQEARDKRLREALFDAEQELGILRKQLEEEYKKASVSQIVNPKTQAKIQESKKKAGEASEVFTRHKNEATEYLVQTVYNVNIEVPKVVIGKFD